MQGNIDGDLYFAFQKSPLNHWYKNTEITSVTNMQDKDNIETANNQRNGRQWEDDHAKELFFYIEFAITCVGLLTGLIQNMSHLDLR